MVLHIIYLACPIFFLALTKVAYTLLYLNLLWSAWAVHKSEDAIVHVNNVRRILDSGKEKEKERRGGGGI